MVKQENTHKHMHQSFFISKNWKLPKCVLRGSIEHIMIWLFHSKHGGSKPNTVVYICCWERYPQYIVK